MGETYVQEWATAATTMAEEFSQSIQVASSTHPGTTYPVSTIPHSDLTLGTTNIPG